MAGVLENDDLSVEDALAYNEALLQAEEAYRKGPQSTDVHLRPGQAKELGSRVESAISGQAGNAGFDQNRTASLRVRLGSHKRPQRDTAAEAKQDRQP